MILLRILLLPFTILYGTAILLRNFFFQSKILTRTSFDLPIICVGNLAAGGTGKTPHIEWIIRQLKDEYKLGVLSRGYRRKTSGYQFAYPNATPEEIGDEPFQIHRKFIDIPVGVAENRVFGIPELLGDAPDTQVVLMDDGYQHLPLKADTYILLTDYNNLYCDDWLLPSGLLREYRSGAKRAAIIVVTKCPEQLTSVEKENIRKKLNPLPSQQLLFSSIVYGKPIAVNASIELNEQSAVIAFSGIANPKPLIQYLETHFPGAQHIQFRDHQDYTNTEIERILSVIKHDPRPNKVLVCTEKDAVKLGSLSPAPFKEIPLFYIPIEISFHDHGAQVLAHYLRTVISSKILEESANQ